MTLPDLPLRPEASHKGTYGRALVVAGSQGMTGAAIMTALAALRSGAGLVTVATPRSCVPIVAAFHPTYMTVGLDEDADGRIAASSQMTLLELASRVTCIAIGPGLGSSEQLRALVGQLYDEIQLPLVVDADGLSALESKSPRQPAGPRVITPHIGEFRALANQPSLSLSECGQLAPDVAASLGATLVLKSHQTLITDGQRQRINKTGNAGMATGGSGDVLTGVILGLIAQGMAPFDAAALGCHLHGAAGDLAADGLGMHGMIATDIIDYLPIAFIEYVTGEPSYDDHFEG